jgi:hypothetical protein
MGNGLCLQDRIFFKGPLAENKLSNSLAFPLFFVAMITVFIFHFTLFHFIGTGALLG